MMKQITRGVILAGGKGTRLLPATKTLNKHLIPVLNEPMILYPLRTLISLGVTDVLIVTGGDHIGGFADFLGDGSEFGVKLTYKVQKEATGIAAAMALAQDFYAGTDEKVVVILGDNIFDNEKLAWAEVSDNGGLVQNDEAVLFLKEVLDPQRFGVAELKDGVITRIEEKPKVPKSAYAVTGLYVYPKDVFSVIPTLKPSARGELEVSDLNNYYIANGRCRALEVKGFWSDAGTPDSLFEVTKWAYQVIHS